MSFLAIAEFLQGFYVIPIAMAIFVSVVMFFFVKEYWTPAKRLAKELDDIIKNVDEGVNFQESKNSLNSLLSANPTLKHAWENYKNSLHDIREEVDGEFQIISSRSTVSSDMFFSQIAIIDTPLKVDFYKHIPGIITGVGIIATFLGLLFGLLAFDPAGDPAKVQSSLALLLGGVGEAFMASGLAILIAMLITWKEKFWLRECYEKLEQLTTVIDLKFEPDETSEEYLSQLLKSSQANETNARQLKDSLVNDLKTMMTNLIDENKKNQLAFTAQLTESYSKTSKEMADQIGQSISDHLQAPLEKIASSVQQVSGDQSSAVQELMTDVLTAFMTKLESTFGSQMTGMSEMMTRSVSAMKEMQLGFTQLLTDMKVTSESSTKNLETQMNKMIEDIQSKQNAMAEQMNSMVDHLTKGAEKIGEQGQHAIDQLNGKVSELIEHMGGTMANVMADIAKQRIQQDQVIADNQQKLHDQSSTLINDLGSEIKELIVHSQNAVDAYKDNIQKLTHVTTESITGMNSGAEKMRLASEQFNSAGISLISVTDKTSQLISEVTATSTHLTSASNNLLSLLSDYKNSQDAVNKAIGALEGLIQQAQSEAGMSTKMLDDMSQMTTALNQVKKEIQDYLEQVSGVLFKSFESFGASVETSLNHSLGIYDNTLDQAVKRLSSGVEGLGSFVEELEDLVRQKKS
ncbi:anti-phage ZorAB system protein ZorA [Acinetobacter sp. 3657]|uniref:anti-phage ZorAB system protein ZorA n=1 Tax=Acinetobacter sp. 3657 TaxID=2817764 RepID=UPI0028663AB5|nr:ABC-type transporter Mla subunit MlaD [Prolinoborus sp. 3657]